LASETLAVIRKCGKSGKRSGLEKDLVRSLGRLIRPPDQRADQESPQTSAEEALPDDLGLSGSEAKYPLGSLAPLRRLELGPHDTPVRVSPSNEQVSDFVGDHHS